LNSIIDYIIVKQKSKFQIHDVRVQRGINCGSDHYVVRGKVYLPIRGRTSNTDKHEDNYEKFMHLKNNLDSFQHEGTQYLYKKWLDEKLTANEEFDLTEIYGNIIQSLHETAKDVPGEKYKRQSCKMWWTEEIEDLVEKKKELCRKWLNTKRYDDKQEYLEIKRKTIQTIIAEKNEMWDRKCQEINTYIGGRKCSEAWKFIKKVRTSEKESVHLPMIPIDKWVQYY